MNADPGAMRPSRPAACGLGLLALAWGMAVSACAAGQAASAPVGAAAAAPEGSACAAPLRTGGAAPPTMARADLRAKVDPVMRQHGGATWTPSTAAALREALCLAGVWRQPGLDEALAPWHLSLKQIETTASTPDTTPAAAAAAASAAGRKVPRRE